ncbi:MAG: hypothetical protein KO464_02275 [Candidatus Methanofastidiosum sp.]|nr:hypothetical protein [Methanofastidiosum sp.]
MPATEQVKKVKEAKPKAPQNSVKEGGTPVSPERKEKVIKGLKAAGLVAAGFIGGILAGKFVKARKTATEVVPFDLNE